MIMEYIETTSGKRFNVLFCDSIGIDDSAKLYIEFSKEYQMSDLATVFTDASEISTLRHYSQESVLIGKHVGYLFLWEAIVTFDNRNVKIRLERKKP